VAIVEDAGTDTSIDATIDAAATGWPRVWGSSGNDVAEAVAVGPDGSVVVVGTFQGSVDFDPTSSHDVHTSSGGDDVFVMKLTADGGYVWTRTWGSPPKSVRDDVASAVAVAADGSILVSGTFATAVDFDPGPGTDVHSPAGNDFGAYVVKLDGSGDHVWARTWGSTSRTSAWGVGVAPDGSVFAAGAFDGVVDLDPGAGVDAHVSNGDIDAYVLELDSTGSFVWGRAWGGTGTEENCGKLAVDAAGSVTVAGAFQSTVDFDPGPGVDPRTALGGWDLFVIQFAADGTRAWARTVDTSTGEELPAGMAVAADGSLAVAGFFYGTVDFGAADVHTAKSQYDGFVMRLASDGSYLWTATWGGAVADAQAGAYAVTIDGAGRVTAGGLFYETVDFDPGPGVVSRTATTGADHMADMYLLRLKTDGSFDAVETWGGAAYDYALGVATETDDSIIAVGVWISQEDSDAVALRWAP